MTLGKRKRGETKIGWELIIPSLHIFSPQEKGAGLLKYDC